MRIGIIYGFDFQKHSFSKIVTKLILSVSV